MSPAKARQVKDLLERYRADLEVINRRIRILEWLAKPPPAPKPARTSQ